jgi:hypothetical protein
MANSLKITLAEESTKKVTLLIMKETLSTKKAEKSGAART